MPLEPLVFWLAVVLLGYTYAGYPLLLYAWASLRRRVDSPAAPDRLPQVSIVVVAYNEAGRIGERIENLLALDYPSERLEVIVASDGSTDGTVRHALAYRQDGVRVVACRRRRGKSAVLNELVPRCSGSVVLLADARQRFERGALRALVGRFADPAVGAVGGELVLTDDPREPQKTAGVGAYWKYEKFIRRAESRIDSTVGVSGAIYAIRRELFEPIPGDTLVDDLLIPMQIVRRGYRVVFEPGARAFDRAAPPAAEFRRKVRTLAGNFQLFVRRPWLLNPFCNRLWFQTVSHKGLRLLGPFCLAAAFGANLLLLDEVLYRWTLGAQAVLYAGAAGGRLTCNSRYQFRFLNVPYAFCLLNWAVVMGLWRLSTGRQRVTWESAGRTETTG